MDRIGKDRRRDEGKRKNRGDEVMMVENDRRRDKSADKELEKKGQ